MEIAMYIIVFLVSAVIFSFIGYIVRKKSAEKQIKSAEIEAQRIRDNAQNTPIVNLIFAFCLFFYFIFISTR